MRWSYHITFDKLKMQGFIYMLAKQYRKAE